MREHPAAKGGTAGEKCPVNFAWMPTSTLHLGIFYMPWSYDMGPTSLLPLWRKACWGFFRPKNPKALAGFEPANLGTKGQHATSRSRYRSLLPPYSTGWLWVLIHETTRRHVQEERNVDSLHRENLRTDPSFHIWSFSDRSLS